MDIDIHTALDVIERASSGDQAATLTCGEWLIAGPVTVQAHGLSANLLALVARAQVSGLGVLTVLRSLAAAAAVADLDSAAAGAAAAGDYGLEREGRRPVPVPAPVVAVAAASRPRKPPRTDQAGAGGWPTVAPLPADVIRGDESVLEALGPHGERCGWKDSAGAWYDAGVHAWSRTHLAPAVTAGGRFRLKQGALKLKDAPSVARGAPRSAPGDTNTAPPTPDHAPQATTAPPPAADNPPAGGQVRNWTAEEAALSNAISAIELASTRDELEAERITGRLDLGANIDALREIELAYETRKFELANADATG